VIEKVEKIKREENGKKRREDGRGRMGTLMEGATDADGRRAFVPSKPASTNVISTFVPDGLYWVDTLYK
jgi:hypothetical protein